MRTIGAVLLTILIAGCQVSKTTDQTKPAEKPRDKTSAEKAFDAGQRARKKAEQLKAAEDKKTKEANDAADQ